MKISVIIPNYNGAQTLPLVLAALQTQSLPANEIIIVDDGSSDNSLEILSRYPEVTVLRQFNSGAPVARNKAIQAAKMELIVMIDNDIIPAPDFLRNHHATHEQHADSKTAVVGLTRWDLSLKLTPFMRWLENGAQFDYHRLAGKSEVDFQAFYTSNLSIKREFIAENLFDESFRLPGATAYEDTELGYRLCELGMKLYFNPAALAYHHEQKTLSQVAKRRFNEGQIAKLLYAKYPAISNYFRDDLKNLISPLLRSALGVPIVWLAKFFENRLYAGPIFWLALLRSYEQGKYAAR